MRAAQFASFWFAAAAVAGPPLTTIQDTLYKADGTRFSGLAQISWTSFEASDRSNVPTQSVAVKIIDGSLRVRLVPTTNATPAARYIVKYNSDGRVQFEETWAVPPTSDVLRVRDVRLSAGQQVQPPVQIQLADVVGLVEDLVARPMKGAGYVGGRAAVINADGALEGATGSAADCVRIDGTSGPCGAETYFIDGETPAGLVDGANSVFSLGNSPEPPSSLELYRNGIRLKAGFDFNLSVNAVQFVTGAVPQPGDTLLASYRVSRGEGVPAPLAAPAAEVLCSRQGSGGSFGALTLLGSCALPPLVTGDRIEMRFDYTGNAGFQIEMRSGDTVLAQHTASSGAVSGQAALAAHPEGVQWNSLLWSGGVVSGSAGSAAVGAASVEFFGSGDVHLRAFTILRYPARQ
jgi:hypothetical protein